LILGIEVHPFVHILLEKNGEANRHVVFTVGASLTLGLGLNFIPEVNFTRVDPQGSKVIPMGEFEKLHLILIH
jgi:hypothetical protein